MASRSAFAVAVVSKGMEVNAGVLVASLVRKMGGNVALTAEDAAKVDTDSRVLMFTNGKGELMLQVHQTGKEA